MNTKSLFSKIISGVITLSFVLSGALPVGAAFTDVSSTSTYADDVQFIEHLGVMDPSIKTFDPNSEITRQEYAKWLLKSAGFGDEGYKPKASKPVFMDVQFTRNPYAPYIYKLRDLGLFDSKRPYLFNPEKSLTREEALTWLFFVQGIPAPKIFDTDEFNTPDVKPNAAIAPMVFKATKLDIFAVGKRANLKKMLTRAQAAHFIRAATENIPKVSVQIFSGSDSAITRNPKFDILSEVFNRVNQDYYHASKLEQDQLIYSAAEGLVKELGDAHSDFERPGNSGISDSLSGQVEGIGAVIQSLDDQIIIVNPIVGSPAEKAGLLSNDIIISVDGVAVTGMKVQDAANIIKGKRGTTVKLEIKRAGQTLTYTVTRDIVKILSTSVKFTPDNIAQIQVSDFGAKTSSEFDAIAKTILDKKPKAIILDLRNNPGGYLTTAISLAGHFVPSGQSVSIVKYPDHEDVQNSGGKGELAGYKVFVLMNGGSASASEILAGCLQDYSLAKVIGSKSYGKGTVQELSSFTDGSTLRLTIAEWLTPKRRSIEKVGIMPDIPVQLTDDDRKANRDSQMDRALIELRQN